MIETGAELFLIFFNTKDNLLTYQNYKGEMWLVDIFPSTKMSAGFDTKDYEASVLAMLNRNIT